MAKTMDIDVHHITRIEGHGNIVLRATDGNVVRVEWQVPEAPRFFEAMVRGRSFEDIQTIVSRICGICSITHSLASIKAIENAMGVEVSEQTDKLRILTHYSEQLQSHSLHVGYLVSPDLVGKQSVVGMLGEYTDAVKTVIKIHRMANGWSDLLAGRTTHPVTFKPGGFTALPTETELRDLKTQIEETKVDLDVLAGVVLELASKLPAFERETEYIALVEPSTYTFYHGDIGSTDTDETVPVCEFERVVNEYVVPISTAKWTRWHRDAYAVGSLARFNLNAHHLLPLAKAAAAKFGLEKGSCNPFMNNVAQLVECYQVVEASLQIIDDLLTTGIRPEVVKVEPQGGNGAGCVEAPRGILFHRYIFDDNGICSGANICIPTNQNHANIQKDFEAWAPQIIDRSEEEVTLLLEMLVRSYDPCVSCSTHYLDVKFI
jgi:coenzyme F420-reducing hydrogenase alpha subunit